MVINNWNLTIEMYQAVIGTKTMPMLFFVSFWCFVVLIIVNVLIALIIEVYSSVEPEVTDKANKMKLAVQISKIVKVDTDRDTMVVTFNEPGAEVRKQLAEIEHKLTVLSEASEK